MKAVAAYVARVIEAVDLPGATVSVAPYGDGFHRVVVSDRTGPDDLARIVIRTRDASLLGAFDPHHLLDKIGHR